MSEKEAFLLTILLVCNSSRVVIVQTSVLQKYQKLKKGWVQKHLNRLSTTLTSQYQNEKKIANIVAKIGMLNCVRDMFNKRKVK